MFENVIVWGLREKMNVCRQAWYARRWTGCNEAFDVEGKNLWEWLTPTDQIVTDVLFWTRIPEYPKKSKLLPPEIESEVKDESI